MSSVDPAAADPSPQVATIPLFPLGTVLFPGLVLPLHVFEERYRALVRHLVELPTGTPRLFGVVAIRRGREVAEPADALALYDVGCTAEVRQVTERSDGRFDIVTVGRRRFEITQLIPTGTPYPRAEVRYLPESPSAEAEAARLAARVLAAFRTYLTLIRADASQVTEQLPDEPRVLSHLVAATASITVADRQALLAAPGAAERLRAELALLRREITLLRQVRAVPVSLSELPVAPGPN